MMDWLTVPVLLIIGGVIIKKRLLPRLKKNGQEAAPDNKKGGYPVMEQTVPDFRILSFNTGDFTYTEDLAHCAEYELGKAISDLKKEGCCLSGDPFPIVMGSSLLILLHYNRKEKTEEVSG